jgi:hypothetical protein
VTSPADGRRLILVVGVYRSGTSVVAGILGQLGFHLPQPEVKADETNPRGFGEPRWVVDFHQRLLRGRRVTVHDARPAAWEAIHAAGDEPAVRAELEGWLGGELAQGDVVVVKDPRTLWFLPLWTSCAQALGAPTSFVTTLRHPAETLMSARKAYGDWQSDASRAAAWLNLILETERETRGAPRAFVCYEDVIADWPRETRRIGDLLGLSVLATADHARFPQVDAFVDPALHRNRTRWDELSVPASLRDMAEDVWSVMQPLARPGGDDDDVRGKLDQARAAYGDLYREAEAIAQSSVTAARPRRGAKATAGAGVAASKVLAAPRPLWVRVARHVPVRYRRGLRRALGPLAPGRSHGPS